MTACHSSPARQKRDPQLCIWCSIHRQRGLQVVLRAASWDGPGR